MIKLLLLLPLLLLSPTVHSLPPICTQTCGPTFTVPFPFGFSSACKIPLNCSNSTPQIGDFTLQNVTSDAIILSVPPSCNRSIDTAVHLFGPNYALTRRNYLLLLDCTSSSPTGCSIPSDIVAGHLSTSTCVLNVSISCFTKNSSSGEFLSDGELNTTRCGSLFGSVVDEAQAGNLTTFAFSAVELGWWVDSGHRCAADADRVNVSVPGGGKRVGLRCRCRQGFVGDGFADGRGCTKACGKCKGSLNLVALVGGGTLAVSFLITGASILLCLMRRRRRHASRTRGTARRLLSEVSFNVPMYAYKTIERATENFSATHRLGTGAYGTVYVGTLTNGDLVAVKKIKHPDPESIDQVINEVKMISSVNHPNLVRLLGCCIDRGEQILVYEFMPNGTLSEHLQRQRGPGLPWTVRLCIAAETAKAITYLHCVVDPPIYHRDIKSSNILLDHQFNAKIADFGLSRAVIGDLSHISTVPQGTPGYVDPQYHQNYHLSDKSDVYSFGVVLMEIITGLKVVDFSRSQSEVNLAAIAVDRIAKGRVDEIVDEFVKGKSDGWAMGSIRRVAELAFRCLAFHREMRPSMMEVADELEQVRLSCWAPKDGEVVVGPAGFELCTSPLLLMSEERKRKMVVVSKRMEEEEKKVESPVSVQDSWASEKSRSAQSSSSYLGDSNH